MAYSGGTTPLPPPPPGVNYSGARQFSHAYGLNQDATKNVAQNGVAPINQMSNGFGGRQGGNAAISTAPQVSSGNRSSAHVATAGNNNVSYASPSLLNSAQSLWQKSRAQGAPAPVNGMSLGFMKNTAPRPTAAAPAPPAPPPAPVVTPPANTQVDTGGGTYNIVDPNGNIVGGGGSGGNSPHETPGVGTVAPGTAAPSPFQNKKQADEAWVRNNMGPTHISPTQRTPKYQAFLKKHGFA